MKYVPGPAFGQFSRSQGNTTASHNRNGSYLRNRTIPADPATPKQLAIRALVQNLSEQWRDITQAQRDGWSSLGDQMTRLDTQGQSYTLTGLQAYTSINMNRDLIALARNDDAPALDVPSTAVSFTVSAAAGVPALSIGLVGTLIATEDLVIEISDQLSAGINFVPRSAYKFIQLEDEVTPPPFDALANWVAIYGALLEANKIFMRGRIINEAGFAGSISSATGIVAA